MHRPKKSEDELYFNPEEQDRLLTYWQGKAQAGSPRNVKVWFLLRFVIGTGLRASEFCQLRLKDINISNQHPHIKVTRGKGNKSRQVYIDNALVKDVKWYLKYRVETLRLSPDSNALLYPSERGNRLSQISLYKVWSRACLKALGKRYGVHSGRHTYGYNYYSRGKDVVALKEQLGHSNISITNRYTRVSIDQRLKIANL